MDIGKYAFGIFCILGIFGLLGYGFLNQTEATTQLDRLLELILTLMGIVGAFILSNQGQKNKLQPNEKITFIKGIEAAIETSAFMFLGAIVGFATYIVFVGVGVVLYIIQRLSLLAFTQQTIDLMKNQIIPPVILLAAYFATLSIIEYLKLKSFSKQKKKENKCPSKKSPNP